MLDPSWKHALVDELIERLEQEYQALVRSQRAAQEAATHEEAKPENDKDTRALESSYLARGQAGRVVELRTQLGSLKGFRPTPRSSDSPIALGSLVRLHEDERPPLVCFLAPAGAGTILSREGASVQVVTPSSPLGRALLGRHQDEDFELESPRGARSLTIVSCC